MSPNVQPLKVLFADNQVMFRQCFASFAKTCFPIEAHYEASNGIEVLEILHQHEIDLVFLDIEMPLMNGEECMRVISEQFREVKVIVISVVNKGADIKRMLAAGARAYIVKNTKPEEIVLAVHAVMNGELFFDSQVKDILIQDQIPMESLTVTDLPARLTDREVQILNLVAQGMQSKEIAEVLHTSKETVEKQRKILLKKIEGRGIADMIWFGLRHGIIGMKSYLNKDKPDEDKKKLKKF